MKDQISLRQFLVLEFVAMMPPLIRATPSALDRVAGRVGWMAFAVAFPVMTGVVWLLCWSLRRLPEGGLGELYCLCFGERLGRWACAVSAGVLLLMMAVSLRFYAERFVSSLYPETDMGMFFLVGLGLALWLNHRRFGTMARAGQIFFIGIIVVIGGILLMNLPAVRLCQVWPMRVSDVPGLLRSGWMVVNMLSLGTGALFALNQVEARGGGTKLTVLWLGGICLLYLCMAFVITGVFSSHLTPGMQIPFFALAKEVRIEGALERMESFVAALWVFADVIMLALLMKGFRSAVCAWIRSSREEIGDGAVLFLLPAGYLIAGSVFALEQLYEQWISLAVAAVFLVLPVLAVGIGRVRKQL